jgi:Fic family protein
MDHGIRLSAAVAGTVSAAEQAIMALNSSAHPALAPLARLLLWTEAIASSKVEGLHVGVRELARAESRMETGGRFSHTVAEVLANVDAMELAIEEAAGAVRVGVQHFVAIHDRLMAGAPHLGGARGIRTVQNWIGGNDYNPCGADFVPPPPEALPALLEDLCVAMEDESLPPIVQAALVHAQFETIHPFDDGNGRTGRALIHILLRRRGLARAYAPPISVILAADRERYIDGLMAFRNGEVGEWIEQFSAAAARAGMLASSYLTAVDGKTEVWRERLGSTANPRADAAAWALIDVLPAHPVITSPVAATATGRAKAAVHNAISQLESCGVLIPLSRSKRNRSWEAEGLLELLEGLEAGRPPTET